MSGSGRRDREIDSTTPCLLLHVRPANVARLYGGALLEHDWNAVLDDFAIKSLPFLCCERKMSRSGGDLPTLVR